MIEPSETNMFVREESMKIYIIHPYEYKCIVCAGKNVKYISKRLRYRYGCNAGAVHSTPTYGATKPDEASVASTQNQRYRPTKLGSNLWPACGKYTHSQIGLASTADSAIDTVQRCQPCAKVSKQTNLRCNYSRTSGHVSSAGRVSASGPLNSGHMEQSAHLRLNSAG